MSENSEPLFLIDSNILVYAYDTTDPHKHLKAKTLLEKCWKREVAYTLSTQNLAEFFIIITKKVPTPLSLEGAGQIINDIISFPSWNVIDYNEQTLLRAIYHHQKSKSHFWDALIVATMVQAGVVHIYTENITDFQKFEGITVVNPLV
ncbi:PIN domain-containing protein [Candidatus Woesearchaeota archaeon]|nr:PIN domain-containing protein [Candidatus Woesearchaeota archaeon]